MRPVSVTVFGVLNIVFGLMGLLSTVALLAVFLGGGFNGAAGMPDSLVYAVWVRFSMFAGVVTAIAQVAAGIGLMLLKPWARTLCIVYSAYAILATVVGAGITWIYVTKPLMDQMQADGGPEAMGAFIGGLAGVVGAAIGLIFPVLLWYFMTRPRVVAAFYAQAGPTGVDSFAPLASPAHMANLSNPFSSPTVDSTQPWQEPNSGDGIVETFVPSKNGPALASYYLGILSLIPCAGLPMGLTAIYFGVQGLKRFNANPAVRGKVHAWVGIVCGGLFALFNLALLGLATVGFVAAAMDAGR